MGTPMHFHRSGIIDALKPIAYLFVFGVKALIPISQKWGKS